MFEEIKKIIKAIRNLTLRFYFFSITIFSQIYYRLLNKPLIHVVGDSHVFVFKDKRMFIAHHIGPATMYNLNKKDSNTKSNEKLFDVINKINRKKDILMLVFGEINCRIHIYYQYKKQNEKFTIIELIDRTISNYGEVLKKIKENGVRFCVYGIPAAATEKNIYNYPFYATPEIHSYIYKEFNNRLKHFCEKNKYVYIDIYPKVSDDKGYISKEFSGDKIHLNKKIVNFVREEVLKNI